ncbi:hypothetical protein [Serratia quinivorans]|uniref:hypothetical protein n=1 Tax=Serratia quinivorans TaxID=137545 RepID=UPI002E76123C|nr:hypothetical protein [Serratia quinivorans]
MKHTLSNKLSTMTLVVTAALTTGSYIAPAAAGVTGTPSTEFTAKVHVISDNTCQINVQPPALSVFDVTWTGNTASDTSSIVLNNSAKDPIKVTATGGADCSLNNVTINAEVPGRPNPRATHLTAAHSVLYDFGSTGGAWAILPGVKRVRLFTDPKFTAETAAEITVTEANGSKGTQTKSPASLAGHIGTYATQFGSQAMQLADSYVGGALTDASGKGGAVRFSTDAAKEKYLSAEIYIGGVIGVDPVNAETGVVNRKVAANGDTAVMPFTVVISEA